MMKKGKRPVMVESSPSSSSLPVGEEARALFKHQCLLQDYQELLKETEAKKKILHETIQKKHQLMAEVKFLKRKYKSFTKNRSQSTPYRVKKQQQSHKIRPPSVRVAQLLNPVNARVAQPFNPVNVRSSQPLNPVNVRSVQSLNPVNQTELPLKDRNPRLKEVAVPTTTAVLDLNQASLPNDDDVEYRVEWEPLKVADKSKRCSIDEDVVPNDLKLSLFKDVASGSNRVGKRKMSWQDQVALRV